MSYLYLTTSQKATAVTTSIVCNFTGPTDRNLIVAKGNVLELSTLKSDAIVAEKSIPLFGKIVAVEAYRVPTSLQDLLFVLTQKKHFCVIAWDSVMMKPAIKATGNLRDRSGKDSESGYRVFIDPGSRMIGVMVYEGQIKVRLCLSKLINFCRN